MRIVALAFALVAAACTVVAQEMPIDARGFAPNRVYDFHDIDSIDLFSGNLNLRIPIGPEYRVSSSLSYRLMLTYNSHLWSYTINQPPLEFGDSGNPQGDCDTCQLPPQNATAYPRGFNAGLGWNLTLGRLRGPIESDANSDVSAVFESSDGAMHSFYPTLHPGDAVVAGVSFTRDGTYMRMETAADGSTVIRQPNGVFYKFQVLQRVSNGNWTVTSGFGANKVNVLVGIGDAVANPATPFAPNQVNANEVSITYSSATLSGYKEIWTITDPARTQKVYFVDAGPLFGEVLDRVELQAINGTTEVYDIAHHSETLSRPWDNTDTQCNFTAVPFLDAITPHGTNGFSFQYVKSSIPVCSGRGQMDDATIHTLERLGVVQSMTLPTRGTISWDYGIAAGKRGTGNRVMNVWKAPVFEHPVMVTSRTVTSRDGTPAGTWTYGRTFSQFSVCTVPCGHAIDCKSGRSRQLTAWVIEPNPGDPKNSDDSTTLPRTTISYYSNFQNAEDIRFGDACPNAEGWIHSEYGLPLTRYTSLATSTGSLQYLSSEVRTGCDPGALNWGGIGMVPKDCGTIAESRFVTYDTDGGTEFEEFDQNSRQSSETTYYGLDYRPGTYQAWATSIPSCGTNCRFTSTYGYNFDSVGHFRQQSMTGSADFTGGHYRTVFTNYVGRPAGAGWQLGLFTEKCSLDESTARAPLSGPTDSRLLTSCGATSIADRSPAVFQWSKYSFDSVTGLLKAQRTYADPSSSISFASAKDVLALFTYSSRGDRTASEYYGGDCPATDTAGTCKGLSTTDDFSPNGLVPAYAVDDQYGYEGVGALVAHSSNYRGFAFMTSDVTFDHWTTLPIGSRDMAGLATSYGYDALGRLTSVTPPAGLAPTSYSYADATSASNAKVTVSRSDSGALLTQDIYQYDGIGRLTKESRLMPNGVATKMTVFDALGWPLKVSGFEYADPPQHFTIYSGYDAFGRAAKVTAPDSSHTDLTYVGVWQTTRKVTPGTLSYETTETKDDKGRLLSVQEKSAENGGSVTTSYGYDVADRLISVSTPGKDNVQERTFRYDGRGFLLSEKHPEKGASGNGTVNYSMYDARGHAGAKIEDGDATTELHYVYDGAERLVRVNAPDGGGGFRVFKTFEFSDENVISVNRPGAPLSNYAQGKLFRSTRHNYLPNSEIVDYVVSQLYEYRGVAGAASTKTTCIEDRPFASEAPCDLNVDNGDRQRVFRAAYNVFDTLGNVTDMSYPTCDACPVTPPNRHVLTSFTNGLLMGVQSQLGTAKPITVATGMSYASNGMLTTVGHPGGVVDTITPDDNLMTRPKEISFGTSWTLCAVPAITSITPDTFVDASNPSMDLSVGVSGDGPFSYQWYKDGLPVQTTAGQQSKYGTGIVTTKNVFYVVVTNSCGSTQSNTITVAISSCIPPRITAQPTPQHANADTHKATLWVVAEGTNLTFEWYEQGQSAGLSSLASFTGAEEEHTYVVTVSGDCGTPVTSDPVTVLAPDCKPLSLTGQPKSIIGATANIPVTMFVTLEGQPSTVTWESKLDEPGAEFGPMAVGGASISVAPGETTFYRATLSNACTAPKTSDVAEVQVTSCSEIRVTQQPADQRIVDGTTTTLLLNAQPIRTPGVRLVASWYQGQTGDVSHWLSDVTGGTNLSLATAPLINDTPFWCRIRAFNDQNALLCAIDLPTVTITVCHKPFIVDQPLDAILTPLQSDRLFVDATGDGRTYQWYIGATGDTTTPVDNGARPAIFVAGQPQAVSYWVRITGECGNPVDSRAATIKLCIPPQITSAPEDMLIVYGQPMPTLEITANQATNPSCSTDDMHYQWFSGTNASDSAPVGTDSRSFPLPLLTGGTYSYYVRVSNCACSTESRRIVVTVCMPPTIVQQPHDFTTTSGDTVTLSFLADDANAIGHWFEGATGDTTKPRGNGPSITVDPLSTTSYWVRVDNGQCATDSRAASVYVCTPYIVAQPLGRHIVRGDTATMFIDVRGTAPITYQWYRGATGDRTNPVPNSNTNTLRDTPLVDTSYWVDVTSSCLVLARPAQSAAALVTVCQPPAITTQPQPASAVAITGTTQQLTVSATGTNIHYQWYTGLPGDVTHPIASTDRFQIAPLITQTTTFWVRITGDCGSVDSAGATITACTPPTISGPNDQTVTSGHTATLQVTVDPQVSVTWYAGVASDISHPVGTGAQFTTPALSQTTSYWARASNGVCTSDSRTATMTICVPPTIVQPPVGTPSTAGQLVRLSVNATGAGGLLYTWYARAAGEQLFHVIAGPDVYYSISVAPTTTTDYWVRVDNGTCSSDSSVATIQVCTPAIQTQPQSTTASSSAPAQLSVTAIGPSPLGYQWYAGQPGNTSSPVPSATTATVRGLVPPQTTTYWVRISTSCGSVDSAAATVTVAPVCVAPAVSSITQTSSGPSTVISVSATGTSLQYEWYASAPAGAAWTLISGANQPTVTVTPSATSYYYTRVFNTCGTQNSTQVTVTVVPPCNAPIITKDPVSASYVAGTPTTLEVDASGTSPEFQWYQSDPNGSAWTPIAGATAYRLTILPSSAVASYYATVTNACGFVQSASATLTRQACLVPSISSQSPSTVTGTAGTTVQLYVNAGGNAPLAYQWYSSNSLGGSWSAIPNATSNTLLPTVNGTAYYYVHITNVCGSVDSAYIMVTPTCVAPSISVQPQSQSLNQQVQVTLSVTAAGDGLTYQWYQSTSGTSGWTAMANGTAASVRFTPQYSPSYYYVRVTGTCGAVNSATAIIRTLWLECPPPIIYTTAGPDMFTPDTGFTLTVDASGSSTALSYQWFVSDPSGSAFTMQQSGTSNTFSYTSQSAQVSVFARVFNSCGSYSDTGTWVYTNSTMCATLPTVSISPANGATITAGGAGVDLSVIATGSGCDMTYQWYQADPGYGWVAIYWATGSMIHVNPTHTEYYECQVTTAKGTVAASTTVTVH